MADIIDPSYVIKTDNNDLKILDSISSSEQCNDNNEKSENVS